MAAPLYSPVYQPAIDPQMLLYMYALKAQQNQAAQKPNLASAAKDVVKGVAKDKAKDVAKGAITNEIGSQLASSAAQNAIYNSGAMQAGGKLAASAAENAAYNAAATEAGGGLAQGVLSNAAGMGALPIAAIGTGTYLGGKAALDMIKGKKPDLAGRIVLGMATGGLSEVANKIFGGHKSTRERAKENTASMLAVNQDDKRYQDYVKAMREQWNYAPPDPSKPFLNGTYATWDEYKKAGFDAGDLSGVASNIKTFGKDWTNLDLEQQKKVTQALINAGMYDSGKIEDKFKDEAKAREIYNSVINPQSLPEAASKTLANKFASGENNAPLPDNIQAFSNKIPVRTPGFDWNGKAFVKRK